MARSLKVSLEYIQTIKLAVKRNNYPTQQALADDIGLSLSTVKSFLNGKPVDYLNFTELSEKLGLDWQEIACLETETSQPPDNHNPPIEDNSPFITGAPIIDPKRFFGREKELKRLFNLLKRHPLQNAAIIGKRRMGKTSLLHYLQNITTTAPEKLRPEQKSAWLPNPENYRWVYVDFQDPRKQCRKGLLSYILTSLGFKIPERLEIDFFVETMSNNLHFPTVILLDEIGVGLQRCPELDDEFWESLRSLCTNYSNGNLAFILATQESPLDLAQNTGHTSPFFNIFGYTATISAFTEAEARELIASSPITFPEADIEWILQESKCVPLLVQILCRERLFSLEEPEFADNWREEGLIQIEQFRFLLA
ncbi:MAG: ATP-binding protein [Oscillatoria sp. PMC 1076.18]|nr:ATP-binding protein [Oscillatoria sp. PMC 1076.18]